MLHKCANSACPSPFRSLHDGKLFLLETDGGVASAFGTALPNRGRRSSRRTERYWLCDQCSSIFTLTFERGRGMITVPLPARNTPVRVAHLTQLPPAMKGYRAEFKGAL